MATFKLNGDFDKVSAELKKTLEAQEAKFNASLQALFKPSPSAKPAAPAKPAASPSAPPSPRDWAQKAELSRSSRHDGDSVRSRLQTSIRTR